VAFGELHLRFTGFNQLMPKNVMRITLNGVSEPDFAATTCPTFLSTSPVVSRA